MAPHPPGIPFSSKVCEPFNALSNFFMFGSLLYWLPFDCRGFFKSNEHFYVKQKIDHFLTGIRRQNAIAELENCTTGKQFKDLGKKHIPIGLINALSESWGSKKKIVMYIGLLNKCLQCASFQNALTDSGSASLHEHLPGRSFWNYNGQDVLGELVMRVRDHFLKGTLKIELETVLKQYNIDFAINRPLRKKRKQILRLAYEASVSPRKYLPNTPN
jgi:predicted NAD-dependent protein-ADP-ribosyltransferase YbiA (DUF1768 family)